MRLDLGHGVHGDGDHDQEDAQPGRRLCRGRVLRHGGVGHVHFPSRSGLARNEGRVVPRQVVSPETGGHAHQGGDLVRRVALVEVDAPGLDEHLAAAETPGDAAWRLTLPTDQLPGHFMDQVMSVWMGPGAHVVCYYMRGGALLNFVGLVETEEISEESWTAKFPWERLKADFVGWHPDIQTVIDRVDKNACFRWSLYYRPPIASWSTRNATLLGDAVHATLPYLAQGACMAIEDAAVLTRALQSTDSVPDALQLYQRNRIPRTSRIVKGADANRTLFHMRDQEKLREAFAARDEGGDRNAWLYSYNPLTVKLV
jgi:salicylate hydroxylase